VPGLAELAPKGKRRMGANSHANGGILLRDLRMQDFRNYGVDVPTLETLAEVSILREPLPELKICVFNIVDLMKL